MVSGPIALVLIIARFAGAGIIYFLGRNFEVAFVTLDGFTGKSTLLEGLYKRAVAGEVIGPGPVPQRRRAGLLDT